MRKKTKDSLLVAVYLGITAIILVVKAHLKS
jgi:hypothetical protein